MTMRYRLGYVSVSPATDRTRWSGLNYYIAASLTKYAGELHWVGPLKERYSGYFKARQLASMVLTGRRRLRDREPSVLKAYARQVAARLPDDIDVVFSPSTLPIAYLECKQPIFFWADATFAGMLDFYIDRAIVVDSSLRDAHAAEQSALTRCKLAIYSSEWAAQSAIANYSIDPSKVKVVPFGANLESERTYDEVKTAIARRPKDCCRLLFVGVDWVRKGGEIALAVAQRLNDEGIPTELVVVGCDPKIDGIMPSFVSSFGFLDKATLAGRVRLGELYAKSTFFIMPSRAEAYGLVFAEACSFGLPCIASKVGGIPTIVRDGFNGMTFKLGDIEAMCLYIEGLMANRRQYEQLALSSFDEYEKRLNWQVAGKTVSGLIRDRL